MTQTVPYMMTNGKIGYTPAPGPQADHEWAYTYQPDQNGGLDYFLNGQPITNTQYGAATGTNTSDLEKQALVNFAYNAGQKNGTGTTTGGGTGGGSGGGGGYSSGGYSPPDYAALEKAYNGQFDNSIQNLNRQQDLAQQISQSGQQQVNQSYGIQEGGLEQQLAQGNAGLDLSQQKLDTEHSNAVRDLGTQMRQSAQSYGNQLGVNGAGDSSAALLANYGLTQQGDRALNDINTGSAQQQTGINLQRTQMQQSFTQNKKMLDDWKSQQIQNITNNYATQLQMIQSQIGSAQSQRAVDLAYIGKGQAANQALSQLSALESSYGSSLSQLQSANSQIQAPSASVAGYDAPYQVSALTPSQISANDLSQNQATSQSVAIPIKLRTSDQLVTA